MEIKRITFMLLLIFMIQGCTIFQPLSPEEQRVKNIESLLRAACVSSSNSEIGFKLKANGEYELKVQTQSGNADVSIDAAVLNRDNQGALNYINEELRASQDDSIRDCIKDQLPQILEELRTPAQKTARCYREKSDEFIAKIEFKTNEQSARAQAPGWRGGRNSDDATLCYSGVPGYDQIEVNFERTSCLGGRCNIDQIQTRVEAGTAKACVHMRAWSESNSGGGGGRVAGYLYGKVGRTLTDENKIAIRTECNTRYNVSST